jgi:hypothetical protein
VIHERASKTEPRRSPGCRGFVASEAGPPAARGYHLAAHHGLVSAPPWVSYAALAASLISIVWNVYSWWINGPRLRLVAHDRPVIFPPGTEDRPPESWLLVVECHNRGRGAAKVHELWLRGTDGRACEAELTENSDPIDKTIDGHSMAKWIISLGTLRNIPLPTTEDGVLFLRPQVTWGGGKKLLGNQVALLLPDEGQPFSPNEQVGKPTIRVRPADEQG